jgi:hypothetical protein
VKGGIKAVRQMLRDAGIVSTNIPGCNSSRQQPEQQRTAFLLYPSASMSSAEASALVRTWVPQPKWLQQWLQPPDDITEPFCMIGSSSSSSSGGGGGGGGGGGSNSGTADGAVTRMTSSPKKVSEKLRQQNVALHRLLSLQGGAELQQLQQKLWELLPAGYFDCSSDFMFYGVSAIAEVAEGSTQHPGAKHPSPGDALHSADAGVLDQAAAEGADEAAAVVAMPAQASPSSSSSSSNRFSSSSVADSPEVAAVLAEQRSKVGAVLLKLLQYAMQYCPERLTPQQQQQQQQQAGVLDDVMPAMQQLLSEGGFDFLAWQYNPQVGGGLGATVGLPNRSWPREVCLEPSQRASVEGHWSSKGGCGRRRHEHSMAG